VKKRNLIFIIAIVVFIIITIAYAETATENAFYQGLMVYCRSVPRFYPKGQEIYRDDQFCDDLLADAKAHDLYHHQRRIFNNIFTPNPTER
jgi:hypothetical protein